MTRFRGRRCSRRRAQPSRARPSGSCSAPAPLASLSTSALAAQACPWRRPWQPRAASPVPAAQPGPGAMGAAAGRSAHLGPAPAGRPLRSLLLLQLLLLVWAPGAARAQGAEFPELCRWVARPGAGFARGAPGAHWGWLEGGGAPGRGWGPRVASSPGVGPPVPEGKLPAWWRRERDRGRGRAGGGSGVAASWRWPGGPLPGHLWLSLSLGLLCVRAASCPRPVLVTRCGHPRAQRLPSQRSASESWRTQEIQLRFVPTPRFLKVPPAGLGEAPECGRAHPPQWPWSWGFGFIC